MQSVESLARRQAGVVSRAQVVAAGHSPGWLRGRLARGHWQRVQPGVYATFSGDLTWPAKAHAALLYAGPGAALGFEAAAYAHGMRIRAPQRLDVWVPHTRKVRRQPGLTIHRRVDLDRHCHGMPRRTWPEWTVLDITQRLVRPDDVVATVTMGVTGGARPHELADAISRSNRVRWRALLTDLVGDVDLGIESPLERRYHYDVERRHGLPRSALQERERLLYGMIRCDVRYRAFATRVELDGQLHDRRRDDDVWRDNEVGISSGELTLRYRWLHVAGTPCRTARQVTRALRNGGWRGHPRRCGPGCDLGSTATPAGT